MKQSNLKVEDWVFTPIVGLYPMQGVAVNRLTGETKRFFICPSCENTMTKCSLCERFPYNANTDTCVMCDPDRNVCPVIYAKKMLVKMQARKKVRRQKRRHS